MYMCALYSTYMYMYNGKIRERERGKLRWDGREKNLKAKNKLKCVIYNRPSLDSPLGQ